MSESHDSRHHVGSRRIAEWVSFAASLALILGIVAHLVFWMLQPADEPVETRVRPRFDRVAHKGDRFVLPFDVQNQSPRTVRDLEVRVRYRDSQGGRESMLLRIDYLGRSSTQTVYAYFPHDPRTLDIEAEPLSYNLD